MAICIQCQDPFVPTEQEQEICLECRDMNLRDSSNYNTVLNDVEECYDFGDVDELQEHEDFAHDKLPRLRRGKRLLKLSPGASALGG